jgi:hypothetical protein
MARQGGVDTHIELSKGFITEVNPIISGPEALLDIDNCIIDIDGTIRRRPGLDLEASYGLNLVNGAALTVGERDSLAFSSHLWEAVANVGTLNMVVLQVGAILQFYLQVGAISQNLIGEIDLGSHAVDYGKMITTAMEMSGGMGNLYVVNPYMEPVRIEHTIGAGFEATPILLKIRDFEGVDDELVVDTRPTTLSQEHLYNLNNQGWLSKNIASLQTAEGVNPSNADIMHIAIVNNADGDLAFDPKYVTEGYLGNTPAAKGHFILDAFNQRRSTVANVLGIPDKVTSTRPAAVAFHGGRVFYAAPSIPGESAGIYYSQQLTFPNREGLCFQEADPTADQINELVATDGGYLPLPGCGEIYALEEIGNGIVVLASNGVWHVSGAEIGSTFSAVSARAAKVGDSGALSATSLVVAEGSIFFWGISGIIQLTASEVGVQATNITQKTIQEFYVDISAAARATCRGVYLPEQRKIFWGYVGSSADNAELEGQYNRILILDFDVGGFYKYTINEDGTQLWPRIVGLSRVAPLQQGASINDLLDLDGSTVTNIDGIEAITTATLVDKSQQAELKLITIQNSVVAGGLVISFSAFTSATFRDWTTTSLSGAGVPMVSYVDFAQAALGAVHTKATPTWVQTFFSKASKSLTPGGYHQLPPKYYVSAGLRMSQSVLEVCNKPASNMRVSQSILEVLITPPTDFRISQSVLEVLAGV